MDMIPEPVVPTKSELPGRLLHEGQSGDAAILVALVDGDHRFSDTEGPFLIVSPRTPYNRVMLPRMTLSATLNRGGDTVAQGPLQASLDPDLGSFYGMSLDELNSGDTVRIAVETPPQLARHDGYETAVRQRVRREDAGESEPEHREVDERADQHRARGEGNQRLRAGTDRGDARVLDGAERAASNKTIVIDQNHNNSVTPEAISPLVTRLLEAGHDVEFYTDEIAEHQSFNEMLASADAFVVIGPGEQYNASEQTRIARFSDNGGRILLVNEPTQRGANGPARSTPMTNIASEFGLGYDAGCLYNLAWYNTNYRAVYAKPANDSSITKGVDRVTMYTARPVVGGSATLVTNETAALSTTRRQAQYTVVAREGNVIALGDRSLLGSDYIYTNDNEVLVSNIVKFLVSGSR